MCPYEHTIVLYVHDRIVTIVVFLLFSAKEARTFSGVSANNPVPIETTSFSNAESEVSVFTFAFQMYPIMSKPQCLISDIVFNKSFGLLLSHLINLVVAYMYIYNLMLL